MDKIKRPQSLKKKILLFMILCWGVPIAVFFTFTTFSYRNGIVEKAEGLMVDELENVAAFASIRVEDAIALCQKPSYEKTWENAWKKYHAGKYSKNEYLQEVNSSLTGKFYLDKRFSLYAYYCYGDEEPECFRSRIGVPYKSYVSEIQPHIQNLIESDSSYACVLVVDNRIFIVRNLYTTMDYERYGTLVVELNRDKLFADVPPDMRENMVVCFNDSEGLLNFMNEEEAQTDGRGALLEQLLAVYDGSSDGKLDRIENSAYNGYLYQNRQDNYHIGVILFAKRSELYSSLYEFYMIIFIMLLLFVPLFCYGIHFFSRHIQEPIGNMLRASGRMEAGEFGIRVGARCPMKNFFI